MTALKQMAPTLALVAGSILVASSPAVRVSRARAAGGRGDDADARAVIARAIEAHGGADKLSRFKAVSAKWAGKRKVENVFYWDAVYAVTYEAPDKVRIDAEVENPKGGTFSFTRVVNGKAGWHGWARGTRDLKDAEVGQIVDEVYAHWLAGVVPLTGKGFEFAPFGRVAVDGKEAVGVRVSCKGRPEVNLFFDAKTGLVVKSERRAKDPGTNEEYTAESVYRDHKAFQGVMWPTARADRRDGADLEENTGRFVLSDYQAHDKLDEKLLAKP